MRTFCMISVLVVFTLACAEPGPVAQRGRRRIGNEESAEVKKKPSVAPITTTTEKEVAQPERTLPAQRQPSTAVTSEQEAAERRKVGTRELLREVIGRVEKERAAATRDEEAAEDAMILGITGLIMEETMTKIGYNFYEYFFIHWEAPQGITIAYNIVIHEKAHPTWGSLVHIDINEITIWNKPVKPRDEEIEQAAKEAIQVAQMYLVNYEQYQFQSEDMIGTGI